MSRSGNVYLQDECDISQSIINEVADQIANDEGLNSSDVMVYVLPLEHAGIDTDEDSADEDDTPSIANLSGRQLRARGSATVHTPSGRVFFAKFQPPRGRSQTDNRNSYDLGICSSSSVKLYWKNSEDIYNPAVANSLTVKQFEEILRYIHSADNLKLPEDDKFAKIKPLFNMLNDKYLLYWINGQNLNVHESMAPYYGRHGAKQFIHSKPIRYGFKQWCLNTPDGYHMQTEPYQGAKTVKTQPDLGVGGFVVKDLISVLPDEDKF
ncbi:PiggyBac transposable element derived 3 [Plakobranchus ocellatus]|uniref:PiggyBac transposable element derived 3 n=1 Tax=Plakobranchus ocellatus TaxID=259542 RepID=A0AAV3Z709_9GAST|nr:PiggyBac transposable element derived 3 [Plakobranchus ocellatus]